MAVSRLKLAEAPSSTRQEANNKLNRKNLRISNKRQKPASSITSTSAMMQSRPSLTMQRWMQTLKCPTLPASSPSPLLLLNANSHPQQSILSINLIITIICLTPCVKKSSKRNSSSRRSAGERRIKTASHHPHLRPTLCPSSCAIVSLPSSLIQTTRCSSRV